MRKPIYIRPLTPDEQQTLQEGLRSSNAFVLRRCQLLLASARGQTARLIAETLGCDDQTVRNVLHAWAPDGQALRVVDQTRPKADPEPKALACYGLLVRHVPKQPAQMLLRFVARRPVSAETTAFLAWCSARLAAQGLTAVLWIWDKASWHISHEVRTWLRQHNRRVKQTGQGVRIVACRLPSKSPWLNPIEPKWVHRKRAIVEPGRLLSAREIRARVYTYYGCAEEAHQVISEKAA